MIFYRPTDGDVQTAPVKWLKRTCFFMNAMSPPVDPTVLEAKKRVSKAFRIAKFRVVDAGSTTTGKDFLLKVWAMAIACPVGVAIVHEGITAETMANIYYELGWMQAYGRETVVIKVGNPRLPSDFVRTEYIALDDRFAKTLRNFLRELKQRASYYQQLAGLLEANPLLAIDYLRRAYLLTGDVRLKRQAREIFKASGLADRALDSVERLMANF